MDHAMSLPASARSRRPHVLVVDDDLGLLPALKSMLESYGFTVSCAHGSTEAMSKLRDQNPDVILADFYMPEGDGLALLNTMHDCHETTPVVVMSGGGHLGNFDQLGVASRLGASATISKPFRACEIAALLRRAIAVPA
jgi:DNA-binding NtrC family response regulator